MKRQLFSTVFDDVITPLIEEIDANNSRIKMKDLDVCKNEIFDVYTELNSKYKKEIFNRDDECLLDRHKIASCICGAFLRVSVFSKQELVDEIKTTGRKIDSQIGLEHFDMYAYAMIFFFLERYFYKEMKLCA